MFEGKVQYLFSSVIGLRIKERLFILRSIRMSHFLRMIIFGLKCIHFISWRSGSQWKVARLTTSLTSLSPSKCGDGEWRAHGPPIILQNTPSRLNLTVRGHSFSHKIDLVPKIGVHRRGLKKKPLKLSYGRSRRWWNLLQAVGFGRRQRGVSHLL